MRRFAIKNKYFGDKTVAYLNYDESGHKYSIDVPDDVEAGEAPLIISDFISKNERHIGDEWSRRWVRERVIPSERQNIGQILRENGMDHYDEFEFLLMNQGRSCQDECYISEIKK